jgi:hypothetical protein
VDNSFLEIPLPSDFTSWRHFKGSILPAVPHHNMISPRVLSHWKIYSEIYCGFRMIEKSGLLSRAMLTEANSGMEMESVLFEAAMGAK